MVGGSFKNGSNGKQAKGKHQENVAPSGYVSDHWYALVHKPVKIGDAEKIPKAKEALEKEWRKLEDPSSPAWLYDTVEEEEVIKQKARKDKRSIHLGDVMLLCHQKHAEMSHSPAEYKGRVVFRGTR